MVDDPFRSGERVVLVPAITPGFALLQGRRADFDGNVVIGTDYDDRLVAQASRHVIVAVAEVCRDATAALAADEQVIPAAYVHAVVLG